MKEYTSMRYTTIGLPSDLWERGHIVAKDNGISFTELIRQAIENQLAGDKKLKKIVRGLQMENNE